MRVVFRVDASNVIGSGHVMRCLRIANRLRKKNTQCSFICRNFEGNLIELIQDNGFQVFLITQETNFSLKKGLDDLNQSFDWKSDASQTAAILKLIQVDTLIVDHYGLDQKWENIQKDHSRKIMAIDDLDNRKHSADILLDQNLFADPQQRYSKHLNANCKKFIGLEYAFIDPDFITQRKIIKKDRAQIKKIFLYLGNTGSSNIVSRILNIFIDYGLDNFKIEVIFSGDTKEKNKILNLISQYKFIKLLDQQPNLAKLMSSCDLAIGAGGATTWERIYLGLPSIVITVADNQRECSEHLNSLGLIWLIGHHNEVSDKQIVKSIKEVIFERNLEKNSYECLSMPIGTKSDLVIDQILQST